MLNDDWIPTRLIRRQDCHKIEIVDPSSVPNHSAFYVMFSFAKFVLVNRWERLFGYYDSVESAKRLRRLIEGFGGLWVKLGQLLSLRSDMLPEAICRELMSLQYRAQGFPTELVHKTFETELGQGIDSVFEYFEEEPIAAASVSQVHLAKLKNSNRRVAVKVLRPDATVSFKRDLAHIRRVIMVLKVLRVTPHMRWEDAYFELDQMVREEIDFRYEASNTRRMRKSLREHGIYVPKVFLKYCSQSILVTEFVDGVLMSDVIRMSREDPEKHSNWCKANNIKPKTIGKKIFHSAMRQLFEDNLFHADIHPGNILLLRDNRLAFIDFGTIGQSETSFLGNYKASLRALAARDYLKAAAFTLRLASQPPKLDDIKRLQTELVQSYSNWERLTHLADIGYHDKSLAAVGSDSGSIMFKYKVQLTWEFMRVSRTWSTLDASLSSLVPNANYMQLFESYFRQANQRSRHPRKVLQATLSTIQNVKDQLEEYNLVLAPMLREKSLTASFTINRGFQLVNFIEVTLRTLRAFAVIAALIYGYAFLKHHHYDMLLFHLPFVHDLANHVPVIVYEKALAYILFFLFLIVCVSRGINRIRSGRD